MTQNSERRNPLRLIVSKDTQLRILWWVSGAVFLTLGLSAVASLWVTEWVWRITLGLAVGAFASLWVSRRVAGPFYRIEKDLEHLLTNAGAGGEWVHLREGDPLQHLARLINQLIERTKK